MVTLKSDKVVLNAVAGTEKTSFIIDQLNIEKKSLILTYTINNQNNLKEKIIKKFGYMPENFYVYGYFHFLLNFIIKPLCVEPITNILYRNPHYSYTSPFTRDKKFVYSNRIAKYIFESLPEFKSRMEKYFDNVFIDEIQDLASDDFNWMKSLGEISIPVILVGDFNQHTYDSSRRGNNLKNLFSDKNVYRKKLEEAGFFFDEETLLKSYRCSKAVCEFVKEKLGINIESYHEHTSTIEFVEDTIEIGKIRNDNSIKTLFYEKATDHRCNSINWGDSKGVSYSNVCIILNGTTFNAFNKNDLKNLKPLTLGKFYVACTRTENNLWFIQQKDIPKEMKLISK